MSPNPLLVANNLTPTQSVLVNGVTAFNEHAEAMPELPDAGESTASVLAALTGLSGLMATFVDVTDRAAGAVGKANLDFHAHA